MELALLICPEGDHQSSSSHSRAVSENPIGIFTIALESLLKLEFSGQLTFGTGLSCNSGSPHVHGIAWYKNAPDVQKDQSTQDDAKSLDAVDEITTYADSLVSIINLTIALDGRDSDNAPLLRTKPQHACNSLIPRWKSFNGPDRPDCHQPVAHQVQK